MVRAFGLVMVIALFLLSTGLQAEGKQIAPVDGQMVELQRQVEASQKEITRLEKENLRILKSEKPAYAVFFAALLGLTGVWGKIKSDHKKLEKEKIWNDFEKFYTKFKQIENLLEDNIYRVKLISFKKLKTTPEIENRTILAPLLIQFKLLSVTLFGKNNDFYNQIDQIYKKSRTDFVSMRMSRFSDPEYKKSTTNDTGATLGAYLKEQFEEMEKAILKQSKYFTPPTPTKK